MLEAGRPIRSEKKRLGVRRLLKESLLGLILYRTPWPVKGVLSVSFICQLLYYLITKFGDSYKAPPEETAKDKGLASEVSSPTKKKGRTVAITAEDMQKRKNDVRARTTLLLALPDEHQLRFSKYDSTKELWEAILKFLDIVSHLEFMDVPIEQDDLNQKFLASLAPEWPVYTIVWRNRDDLNTMSLDDVYNHLKVYEQENLALLSMRAARFWKKTSKKITIQGSDVVGFDKLKVECFNCHKMGHFAKECRSPKSEDRGKKESYKKDPKVEEPAPKVMIAIDGIGWDWSYMAEKDEASKNHTFVANEEEVPTEYALMAKSSSNSDNEVYDDSFCSKSCRKNTDNLNTKISKLNEELSDYKTDLYNYKRESQKLDKDMKGVGFNEYCVIPPPPAQVYSPPKKYLSWMGLLEFVDDTVTDYTRPTPSIDVSKSVSMKQEERWKSNNPSFFEQGGSSGNVVSNRMIKFMKESSCPNATKVNNTKNTRKPTVKYAEMYRNTSQIPRVRGNQRN
nr:hypothetical protein [Tanacetum cinerariifolium]